MRSSVLVVIFSVMLSGCGGGGGSSSALSGGSPSGAQTPAATSTEAFEGRVVDAPISGASVFIDLNGNDQQDDGEPSGVTDGDGFFSVDAFTPTDGVSAKVISIGGVDTKTGKSLPDLALISDVPADLTKPANVTPLTTIVASVDTSEEKAQLLQALGIDQSPEELLTVDNWAAAADGDDAAKAAQRVNQQVGLLLQTAATVVQDDDDANDLSVLLAKQVAAEISAIATTDGGIDFSQAATLTTVLSDAVAQVAPNVVVDAGAIAAVAQSVATVNAVVADPALDPLSDVVKDIVLAAQGDLQTSVAGVLSGDVSLADFSAATSATTLFSNVSVSADALDTDEDGIPDVLDIDDDGDGVKDALDAFSKNAAESLDTDGDGIGNNADTDDDGDGVADGSDAYPLISLDGATDTDGDGRPDACEKACVATGMAADTDDDGDMVPDEDDAYPLISLGTNLDTDLDGRPDDCDTECEALGLIADTDDDGDGALDFEDPFPLDGSAMASKTLPSAIGILK